VEALGLALSGVPTRDQDAFRSLDLRLLKKSTNLLPLVFNTYASLMSYV
jgi:hypothetical protein